MVNLCANTICQSAIPDGENCIIVNIIDPNDQWLRGKEVVWLDDKSSNYANLLTRSCHDLYVHTLWLGHLLSGQARNSDQTADQILN